MERASADPESVSLVRRALKEDHAREDATSLAVVPESAQAMGRILARESGVLAGTPLAALAFSLCDESVEQEWHFKDGDSVSSNEEIFRCSGPARALLAAERTALNLLQQLSGVASSTARLVSLLEGEIQVMDTRKTVPGLRDAQKAAVLAGGGVNQRRDLEDELLLKENHFALSSLSYEETVAQAVAVAGGKTVGVEARTQEQALQAFQKGAAYVLLDNFSTSDLPQVVRNIRAEYPHAILEASGGFEESNIAELRGSGVDRVSVGATTHSVPSLDLSFYLEVP
ncbi:MAG: carboxylating nicotinate-nucleotide diphosphorylase [Planctomycetota bacterium]|jgi:nicotinate-nucleotide pyrophosphorylase (carboxylating)|nr:carboxylating nicotinate-nucleotide diphosphorylase [Planctomycetota bacterium]